MIGWRGGYFEASRVQRVLFYSNVSLVANRLVSGVLYIEQNPLMFLHRGDLGLHIFKGLSCFSLEVEGILVELDQRVWRRFNQALAVRVELDGRLRTEVSTDNLRHVGIILFKASIRSVASNRSNGTRVDLDVGIRELNKGFPGDFWKKRLINRSGHSSKSAII